MPDETNMRDIFLRELRQSKKIKHDLEIYDRAKEGSEQHTYLFLKNSVKEMLTRERKHKNRDRIARPQGDKYGAAASPRSASPSRRGGREKPQSSRGSRPRSPGRGRSQSPNKPRTPSPKGVCYDFLKGTGNNCPFLHKKRSLSPNGPRTPKKTNRTCKFWKEGACTKGDKSRGKPEKPAACAFAAVASPGPQSNLEDSWEVDFKGGRLIRHHRTYRKDWFVPDNSYPVNAKLQSHVKVERVLPVHPCVANQQYDWKQQVPQKPDDFL